MSDALYACMCPYCISLWYCRIHEKMMLSTIPIDKDYFREFAKSHNALLFPAFELQRLLRKKCLGKTFWIECSKRRIELSNGHYLTVAQINDMINKNAFSVNPSFSYVDDDSKYYHPQKVVDSDPVSINHDVDRIMDVKGTFSKRRGSNATATSGTITPQPSKEKRKLLLAHFAVYLTVSQRIFLLVGYKLILNMEGVWIDQMVGLK